MHSISSTSLMRPRPPFRARQRMAFTLVELLVVIAIIGTLVGLLLPAVQAAREAARRSSCQNNLKHIGLALTLHHEAQKKFPRGSWCHTGVNGYDRGSNWRLGLLPYLEEETLSARLNFTSGFFSSKPDAGGSGYAPGYKDNDVLKGLVLNVYRCPSSLIDPTTNSDPTVSANDARGQMHAYVGIAGATPDPAGRTSGIISDNAGAFFYGSIYCGNGILLYNNACQIKDVTDGLSKTLIIAEQSALVQTKDLRSNHRGGWHGCRRPQTVATINNSDFWGVGLTGIRYPINSQDDTLSGATSPALLNTVVNSSHPGGINALRADGSVDFLTDTIDFTFLRRLAVKDDGQSLNQ